LPTPLGHLVRKRTCWPNVINGVGILTNKRLLAAFGFTTNLAQGPHPSKQFSSRANQPDGGQQPLTVSNITVTNITVAEQFDGIETSTTVNGNHKHPHRHQQHAVSPLDNTGLQAAPKRPP